MHIVIEGQDATGKDTQAKLLAEYLRSKGKNVVHYSESGTGSEDEFIREIAKLNYGSKQDIDHRTRVMLYLINRRSVDTNTMTTINRHFILSAITITTLLISPITILMMMYHKFCGSSRTRFIH